MTPLKITSPEPNKALRPDFDYNCECGFYVCDTCGIAMYPMEVEGNEDEDGYDRCFNCEDGDMVQYVNNMNTKHTPAPWDFNTNLLDSDGFIEVFHDGDVDGTQPIADIHSGESHELGSFNRSKEETEANARLISASPELLEACKMVLSLSIQSTKMLEVRELIKKAINKVT